LNSKSRLKAGRLHKPFVEFELYSVAHLKIKSQHRGQQPQQGSIT